MKESLAKNLKKVLLDIVPAIPCAPIYRNCKTPEIVKRAPGGLSISRREYRPVATERFRVHDFVFGEFCNRLIFVFPNTVYLSAACLSSYSVKSAVAGAVIPGRRPGSGIPRPHAVPVSCHGSPSPQSGCVHPAYTAAVSSVLPPGRSPDCLWVHRRTGSVAGG